MTVIISKENFKIIQQSDQTIFRIEFATKCPALLKSIAKRIVGSTITDDYQGLKFKAYSVKSLQQFQRVSVASAIQLTSNLVSQLKYLLEIENHCIIGYSTSNVIVINEKTFVFLGSECVTELLDDDQILISYPFSHSDFFVSPEQQKITELPSYVHFKTAYFSLACLVMYTLLGNDDFYYKYLQREASIMDFLNNHPIKHTKLYWLLSRCLVEEPESRRLLFI